jgi:hypothetical protein
VPTPTEERLTGSSELVLTTEQIAAVFSMLQLSSEEQREKFLAMSQGPSDIDKQPPRIWLTGTTDLQQENQGGPNA